MMLLQHMSSQVFLLTIQLSISVSAQGKFVKGNPQASTALLASTKPFS